MKTLTKCLITLPLVACATEEDVLSEHESEIYTLTTKTWTTRDIPVCFESASPGSLDARNITRDAVEDTWERVANIDFTGWGICADDANGIRIIWEDVGPDDGPHTKGLGTELDGLENGMSLDEKFVNWSPSYANNKTFYIRAIAIHEFGHALGFSHEHNRDDRDMSCTDDPQGTDGNSYTTSYDKDSVMNYCAKARDRLSTLDVVGVRRIYGGKPARSLVSNGGKCVSVANGGSWALTDGCETLIGQYFDWGLSKRFVVASGQCLDTYGTSYSMYGGTCVSDAYQQFTFEGNELRGFGDQCLDVMWAATATPGTAVQAYPCWSSTMNKPIDGAQKWSYTGTRELRTVSGLCLQADGSSDGANVTIRSCTGAANQKWNLDNGLVKSDVGKCMDFNYTNGDVYLFDCTAVGNAKEHAWHLSGPIKNRGNCVQVNGSSEDGRTVFPTTCANSDRQMFDYYF